MIPQSHPAPKRIASRVQVRPNRGDNQGRRCTRGKASDDRFADYKPTISFLFPGQGAQTVGMAGELCEESQEAKELFDRAAEILGYDLLSLCVQGPKEKLDTTAISQPAIYVASLAALAKLRQDDSDLVSSCDVAAGLSLGEYTALTFADVMSFEDGLKLVKIRGESMQAAADAAESGMVSIIGLGPEKVQDICTAANEKLGSQAVQIANYLCSGNYVISGSKEGCTTAAEIAKSEFKARMTVPLAVAGAFHTDYMSPAVDKLKEALANISFSEPRIPVISNVDSKPHSDPETIKDILSRQVTSPVQWEATITDMLQRGLGQSYEIGPGNVIAGLIKRIDRKHKITNVKA